MSKAKGLTYESKEPAFLRRLRGEVAGSGDVDRHERPIARPRLKKDNDEDDGPTYVVEESGDTLSKADYEAMVAGKGKDEGGTDDASEGPTTEEPPISGDQQPKQQVAEIGNPQKKRKVGKVVGEAENAKSEEKDEDQGPKKIVKRAKKKAKAVKLSFDDD